MLSFPIRSVVIAIAMLAPAALLGCAGSSATTTAARTETSGSGGSADSAAPRTLEEAVAMPHRSDANRARDAYRHPAQTLAFFELRPDMRVVELSPGNGWYTEILAPYLRRQGHLTAAIASVESPNEYRRTSAIRFLGLIEENAAIWGPVETVTLSTPQEISLGPDGSADAVVTFRNLHNWMGDDRLDQVFADVFRVLAPGGIFGVVEHRAAPGTDPETGRTTGYLPEAWVIERITAAGFVLEASEEINANPNDSREHPEGVWSLPPVLRGGDVDRAQLVAIGESDRMTLRFRKPR